MAANKAELQSQIDEAIEVLSDADSVESTRSDLATALTSALAILRGEEDEEEEDEDDDDSDDE